LIDRLKEAFPHVPENVLSIILNFQYRALAFKLKKRHQGITNSCVVSVKGLGDFYVGDLNDKKKYKRKLNKTQRKRAGKMAARAKRAPKTFSHIFSILNVVQ